MKIFTPLFIAGSLLVAGCSSSSKTKGMITGGNSGRGSSENGKGLTSAGTTGRAFLPASLKGVFKDDYGSTYQVNDSQLIQQPGNRYAIVFCDSVSKMIIARNDSSNTTEPGLYTRIDYMFFNGMEPWSWGYCLTVYNAISDSAAMAAQPADRNNPRKGCNGFPFTRMKPAQVF